MGGFENITGSPPCAWSRSGYVGRGHGYKFVKRYLADDERQNVLAQALWAAFFLRDIALNRTSGLPL